jgi:hypothetical protein
MISVLLLVLVTCNYPYVGVFLVTVGLAFSGLTYGSGFLVNYNDVGGAYAGMVFGISNTIGTLSGIVAPYLVGALTKNVTIKYVTHFPSLSCFKISNFAVFRKSKKSGGLCLLSQPRSTLLALWHSWSLEQRKLKNGL